jgi:hypothetical protein
MRWPCWLIGHAPLLQTSGPVGGARTIQWICQHCLKPLGETVLTWTPRDPPPHRDVRVQRREPRA